MDVILQLIGSKWELIPPFARANNKTIEDNLKDGEKEFDVCQDIVHIVTWDGDPPKIVKLSAEEIEELKRDPIGFRDNKVLYREKCFLWIIDESSLKIAREKKRNVKRAHDPDFICHTNLTNGGKAYIGGEVLFGEDGFLYVNNFSDRYGGRNTPPDLWSDSKRVFIELGYTNLTDIIDLIG